MTTRPDWTSYIQWIRVILMMAGLFIGLPFAVVIVFAPVGYLAFDASCRVQGFVPSLQARIQEKRFWRRQLELLDEELQRPSIEDVLQDVSQSIEDLYQRYPDLRPSPRQIEADRLRKEAAALLNQADAVEYPEIAVVQQQIHLAMELERQRVHEVLRSCRSTVEDRAQPE